jgi:hypothetical protein
VRELLTATRSSAQIEVNGDVDESNVSSIVAACATIVMAGNAIFGSRGALAARSFEWRRRTRAGRIALLQLRVRSAASPPDNELSAAVLQRVKDLSAVRIASCNVASAAGSSRPRCTRSARRSRSARTWKSPRAWAALTIPNV